MSHRIPCVTGWIERVGRDDYRPCRLVLVRRQHLDGRLHTRILQTLPEQSNLFFEGVLKSDVQLWVQHTTLRQLLEEMPITAYQPQIQLGIHLPEREVCHL